ncbi:(Fe-S)-binding protein [Gracilibacillus timonensis]|uniref:(Fe-S)-binding protein n=1 Tax=Gracilibacillus timonensis TaxID=1816696 RepID=UPI000825DEE8|nr:(Fe-S)-binding protein [Gracilibacillus timonensis]
MTTAKERTAIQQQFQERMDQDELMNCMRCGFCLPACPTYIESGYQEEHSPRGRLALMKAVADGEIEPDEDVERSLDMCLGCRACEPVCPAGVNYGHLLEESRDIIQQNKQHSLPIRTLRKTAFQGLFPHQNRMQSLTGFLSFYQRSGLQSLFQRTRMNQLLPNSLAAIEQILPKAPTKKEMKQRPTFIEATIPSVTRVAFFSGCLMDTMFMETNDATLQLLKRAGCEIVIPQEQGCCGALHGHSGEKEAAKALARRNIEAFEQTEADYIISNAGGCGAFLIDYDHLLKDDPEWAERAQRFTSKVKDITSILVDLHFHLMQPLSLPAQTITYQDSCHLRNVMKTEQAPRTLLGAIDGIHFQEMEKADSCCGSAGIYNIVETEMSMQILDTKMAYTKASNASTIVTANPGCLLQMKLGIEREGLADQVRAVHIVDLLLEAVNHETSNL